MKLTNTVLLTTLLATAMFAGAQTQTETQPNAAYSDNGQAASMASHATPEVGTPMIHAVQPETGNNPQNDTLQQKNDRNRQDQSPYWEPKDWNYIRSEGGVGG